jgi:quinol monooxygenase YgiN
MRLSLAALCLAALAMTSLPASAQTPAAAPPPPPEGQIHIVTYVETNPAWMKDAEGALRNYRDATFKEQGAINIAIYQETTRSNRFVVNEAWKDFAAYDTHAKSSKLADALKAGHLAPPDSRAHTEWSVTELRGPSPDAVALFTHIDVSPPQLAGLQEILKPYIEKTRADKGMLRFDLLQGVLPRKNHQTLAESWASEADFSAHQVSAHAIEFRDRLGPLLGALYDQRIYKLLN